MWNKPVANLPTSHHFPVYEEYVNCEQFDYAIHSRAFEHIICNVTAERNHKKYLDTVGVHVCFDRPNEKDSNKFNWKEYWSRYFRQRHHERVTYFREFPLNIDNCPYYSP